MSLTDKEHTQLITLLGKANVIWQFYEKEHIADDLSDKEWKEFVALYQDNFCEGAYYVVDDLLGDYQHHLTMKKEEE